MYCELISLDVLDFGNIFFSSISHQRGERHRHPNEGRKATSPLVGAAFLLLFGGGAALPLPLEGCCWVLLALPFFGSGLLPVLLPPLEVLLLPLSTVWVALSSSLLLLRGSPSEKQKIKPYFVPAEHSAPTSGDLHSLSSRQSRIKKV